MEISKSKRGGARPNSGGRRPNSGRKSKAEELGLAEFWGTHLPAEKRAQLANRMYEIATGDDVKAAVSASSLLLAYAFGKPTEKHEVGGAGGGPIVVKVVYA